MENKLIVTKKDLKGYSLDEMLTKSYGKKGTKSRTEAENKIAQIANNLSIKNTLKEIREVRAISQKQIAKAMKIDPSGINRLENNFKAAQINTILKYAKALKAKNVYIVFEFPKKEKAILILNSIK